MLEEELECADCGRWGGDLDGQVSASQRPDVDGEDAQRRHRVFNGERREEAMLRHVWQGLVALAATRVPSRVLFPSFS